MMRLGVLKEAKAQAKMRGFVLFKNLRIQRA